MKYLKIGLLTLFIILFYNCENLFGPEEPEDVIYNGKYQVTGTANTVFVTYENQSGGISQESDVSIPWSYSFQKKEGEFVYISAQNEGANGSVTVTIYRDGYVFKTSTSEGAYVIATASGTL